MFLLDFRGANTYKKTCWKIRPKGIFLGLIYFQGMGDNTVGVLDILVPLYHNFNSGAVAACFNEFIKIFFTRILMNKFMSDNIWLANYA